TSTGSRPAPRSSRSSSAGRMNSRQSWVPRGTIRSTCSSPNTPVNHDQKVRLTVSKTKLPPGASTPASSATAAPARRGRQVGQVLEHVGGDHDVEAAVGEREAFQPPLRGAEGPD